MAISANEAKKQFDRAKKLGWIPYFEEAARTITVNHFDTADLLAIGSRETNLDPKWLTKAGDGGNGFGLMQADKRSFPEFTKGDGWKDARTGILFGAKVLMQKWNDYESNIGKKLTVKSSKGGVYRYVAEKADGADAQKLVISSYNCGRWSQYAFANNQDIDKYSTGHDYAKDVMSRAAQFRKLLIVPAAASVVSDKTPSLKTSEINLAEQAEPKEILQSAPVIGDKIGGLIEQAKDKVSDQIDETLNETKQKAQEEVNDALKNAKDSIQGSASDYVRAGIPNFKKTLRKLGAISFTSVVAFIVSYVEGLPWYVLLLSGYFSGIATSALIFLWLYKTHRISILSQKVLEANADPNMNNIRLVQLPTTPGFFTRKFNEWRGIEL